MPLKIGAYIRVSTEEQAQVIEGSLDSQKFRIKGYVDIRNSQESAWGQLIDTYVDDGFSAKDTRRPAYQRMMRDIRTGKINLILVTDISRLSRNISDFCDLLKDLEKHKAKFLSIKEQFDSSTPAGEMMLFNMINLAQFERKQTSERVATNFHARALRGLKNGGSPILGYDSDPANKGKLIVNKQEALWVEKAFEIYLKTGSTRATAVEMNRLNIPRKVNRDSNKQWSLSSIKTLLRNRAYIGEREINADKKEEDQESLKAWQRHQVVKASWPAIMDKTTFNSVQRLLDDARKLHRNKMKYATHRVFILSGVIRCGECGRALIGQSAHGKNQVHRYYAHSSYRSIEPVKCSVKRYNADEVEKLLLKHLATDAQEAGYLDDVKTAIINNDQGASLEVKKEIGRIEKAIQAVNVEIENVFRLQSENPFSDSANAVITERIEALSKKRRVHQDYLAELKAKQDDLMEADEITTSIENKLMSLKKAMTKAEPATLKRLIRNMYDVLILREGRLEGYYITTNDDKDHHQSSKNKKASGDNPEALLFNSNRQPFSGWHPSVPKVAYWSDWWT